jgi:uncharacterized protein (DUF1919 family)
MFKIMKQITYSLSFRYKHFKKRINELLLKKQIETHYKYINKIKIDSFSIISSNCWAGSVYEDIKSPYQTPTVGLFFYAPCFIEFLKDLQGFMNVTPEFISSSRYPEANLFRIENDPYPIGLLKNSVEIHFLHYKSDQEALEKWERRKQRINWDKLFIACTDRDRMTPELMKEFDELTYTHKVLFTAKKHSTIKCAVQIEAFKNQSEVGDLYNQRYFITASFDLKKWLCL